MKLPHIKLLDWYIIKKYIGTYFFTILIAVAIIIIFDISEKIEKFVEHQAPLDGIIFDYYAGFIPWILNTFCPLFVFVSAIFFTSKLSQNSEIIAMLSTGVSFKRLLAPYMASAALIAAFSMILGFYIIPPANKTRLDFEDKYVRPKDVVSNQRNIHYQVSPGEFMYVEQFSTWSNTAYRFTLEKIEDDKLVSKLSAESAAWDTTFNGWRLHNYFQRDFYGESEMVEAGNTRDTVLAVTVDDFYRRENYVASINQKELNEYIRIQNMRGDAAVKKSLIEKHNRIAMPFSAFVLSVIAVSLSSRRKRGGLGLNIGIGIALSFIYILFMRFSEMFVRTDTLPVIVAIWLPNFIFSIVAFVLYKLAPK
ncbi:MAG: LptF/LptG family permease [Bacteroidales bacterium]|nr:LptF/LptG family permease [Candidatus Cacconaster merdequi]